MVRGPGRQHALSDPVRQLRCRPARGADPPAGPAPPVGPAFPAGPARPARPASPGPPRPPRPARPAQPTANRDHSPADRGSRYNTPLLAPDIPDMSGSAHHVPRSPVGRSACAVRSRVSRRENRPGERGARLAHGRSFSPVLGYPLRQAVPTSSMPGFRRSHPAMTAYGRTSMPPPTPDTLRPTSEDAGRTASPGQA